MNFSLHPDAERDLREAAEFYRESAGNSLSHSFLVEIERAISNLLRYPELGAPWHGNTRRYVMSRFPYSLIYTVFGEEIRIFAVAHHSRRPGYWRKRK